MEREDGKIKKKHNTTLKATFHFLFKNYKELKQVKPGQVFRLFFSHKVTSAGTPSRSCSLDISWAQLYQQKVL